MKQLTAAIISLLLALGLTACGGGSSSGVSADPASQAASADSGKTFEINLAHVVNEDNSWHKAAVNFKEQLETESGGRIKVNIYPNNQLGTEIDVINAIITDGDADITFTGESMQSVIPEMGILGVPYLMTSSEMLNEVASGPIGKKLEALMLQNANMRTLGYFERGPRNVTSNKEIRTPEDMAGFVIRVPASPITVAVMESFGAKPTPMAFAEVFTSLQQKTIDGQENPLAMIQTGNFYEVQKYLVRTEHLRSLVYIVMSESKLQSMPQDLQDMVIKAGADMQAFEHKIFEADEIAIEEFLKEKGMTFIEDVDQAAFEAKAKEGVEAVLPDALKPLYEEISALKA